VDAVADARALCIGDGVHTDVKGARDHGLDCLFVSGGIHGLETTGLDGGMDPDKIRALLAAADTAAAYAMPALNW
jgi:ribonucleotide monophosphatase NagD (HAD superfamily)